MPKTTVYELAVLYRPSLEGSLEPAAAEVKKLITAADGKGLAEDDWGKRQLAYKIGQETHAIYVFYDIEIDGLSLTKIEAALNISENVLRYQFHKPDFKAREATVARQAERAAVAAEEADAAEQSQEKEEKVKQDVA